MDKVMKVLKNKWFILFISILNGAYTVCLCGFAYAAMFYKIEFVNTVKFAVLYSVFSVVIGLFMYYTRQSALTAVFNMLNMFAFLPPLLLDWGNWPLLIPAAIVTLFGFFSCKMNDTIKTVFGTIFLLMYIVCCVGFFLVMNVFRVSTINTVIEQGDSPSGYFRYYVMNVENKSSGKTAVYVEPNCIDINFAEIIRLNTTIKKLVRQANNPTTMQCRWEDDVLYINDEEYFCEKDFLEIVNDQPVYDFMDDNWTHTYFDANYPLFAAIHKLYVIVKDKLSEMRSDEGMKIAFLPAYQISLAADAYPPHFLIFDEFLLLI